MLYFKNQTKFFDDGSFVHTQCNIIEKTKKITENTIQVIFSLVGVNKEHINKYSDIDTEFDWIEKGRKLYQIGYVEDVFGAEELIFKFAYEYLKLNPKDYFWVDSYEWAFSFEDI
ncbi:hypothetical protein [Clostridium sp.]|uniref:hypothetical protein n=1 Tax=Clostridium sp. TaxID=1506 RepID=UPI00262831F4|nr:hypothetical protein [Clostridium sp.]